MAQAALKKRRRLRRAVAVAAAIFAVVRVSGADQTLHIDPARSRTTIHVGKAGVFSFLAGHSHQVAGPIESGEVIVDPERPTTARIRLTIAASDLRVSPAGEPEGDPPKVQEAMDGPKVLDVAQYPRITYESSTVTVQSRHNDVLELAVSGKLTIRDVTRPVTAAVHAELTADTVTARGRFAIKQSAFGITPISVAGVVAVKDELQIDFTVVAQK
jgi:polyisoprenoid-binding protein YceI